MTLGFQHKFVNKILSGTKIHTIREDKTNRWKKGNKIHFCTDIRTKKRNQFNLGICTAVRDIEIDGVNRVVKIDGEDLNTTQIKELYKNDGFDSEIEFWEWLSWNSKPFKGKLIYWT